MTEYRVEDYDQVMSQSGSVASTAETPEPEVAPVVEEKPKPKPVRKRAQKKVVKEDQIETSK